MRTGSKVARLEGEMLEMRSLLRNIGAKQGAQGEGREPCFTAQSNEQTIQSSPLIETPSLPSANSDVTDINWLGKSPIEMDVIDRGILPIATSQSLMTFFAEELTDFFPLVLLPRDMEASFLRRQKPILFLSIMAASAVTLGLDVAKTLHEEFLATHARSFFLNGEKSLELIQALLLAAVFEYPPSSRERLRLCQFTHIACTMILELGLHVRFQEKDTELFIDDRTAQARAILISYHLASSIAAKSGGLNMLPRNDFLKDCAEILDGSRNVHNQQLACWFQLQKIIDDTLMAFSADNTRYKSPGERPQLQPILRYFGTQMRSWEGKLIKETTTNWMMLEYYYTQVVVYEAANGEAFRDPDSLNRYFYMLPPLGNGHQRPGSNPPLNAAWVDISAKWMDAAQGLLNAFLAIDIPQVRKLPERVFSRVFAAITSLLKIYDTARRTALGTIIQLNSVVIWTYIDSVTQNLFLAGLDGHYKVPSRWYRICLKKREWFHGLEAEDLRRCDSPSLLPLQHSVTGMDQAPSAPESFNSFPITGSWASGFRNEVRAPVYDIVNGAMATTLSTRFPYADSSIMEETHSRVPEFRHGQWQ
ncbi:hypothetical protein N7478_004144 [Penicillium angulare]|uniref:uncharacterized protein n=1 Tax=Penicillium angulare TaxID=116970 RepID=UPI002541CD1F|nr:uncharacterized protein N7478_004144 [Penicillium angulare]KAJ5278772.1 hypothetical protein N7478_004144 [Penicillium angulare]